jgi:hypothetical protein
VKTNYGGGNIVKRSADAERRSGLIRLSCMRREQRQSVAQHRPHQPLPVTPIFSVLQHAWGPGCLGLQPQVKLIPSRVERAFSALLGSGFSHSARVHGG